MSVVHFVVPEGIDDRRHPSGGNTYDRRIRDLLPGAGWRVAMMTAPGTWPRPEPAEVAALAASVGRLPDGAVLLIDGLIASAVPDVLRSIATRCRVVVLVHLPYTGDPVLSRLEREALTIADGIITTSEWTSRQLIDRYQLSPHRIRVAHPGTDPMLPAPRRPDGGSLLCVAAVSRLKGHDLIIEGLRSVRDLTWTATFVGATDIEPGLRRELQRSAAAGGIGDRIHFTGALTGRALAARYAEADALIMASRTETYGMVAAEALAVGIPVIAPAVGGLSESVGRTVDGIPGILFPAGRPIGGTLRRWLTDPVLRAELSDRAHRRRATLPGWSATCRTVVETLVAVSNRVAA